MLTHEDLKHININTEIECVHIITPLGEKGRMLVEYYNEGEDIGRELTIYTDDFETWFSGRFGLPDDCRGWREYFDEYYENADMSEIIKDVLEYLTESKSDLEAHSFVWDKEPFTGIFESIANIVNPNYNEADNKRA